MNPTVNDLPGWTTPPRVADIPDRPGTWAYIHPHAIGFDSTGHMWVNPAAVPRPVPAGGFKQTGGAVVAHTPTGLGLWVQSDDYDWVVAVETKTAEDEGWTPVAATLTEADVTAIMSEAVQ